MSQEKINYSVDDCGTLHIFLGNWSVADIEDCGKLSRYKIQKLINETLSDMGYIWLHDGTIMKKERHDLLSLLVNFTKESHNTIETGVMKPLDDIQEFIHYLREGDSDITGQAAQQIIDEIIKYMLS